jgi:hypothetical protein
MFEENVDLESGNPDRYAKLKLTIASTLLGLKCVFPNFCTIS